MSRATPKPSTALVPTVTDDTLARAARIEVPAIADQATAVRVTNDMAFVRSVRVAIERAKKDTLTPLLDTTRELRLKYDALLAPVLAVEERIKTAIAQWHAVEADRNRQAAADAAAAQAAVAGAAARHDALAAGLSATAAGEIAAGAERAVAVDAAGRIAPAEAPRTVRGEAGTATVRQVWTWEVIDEFAVPRAYLVVDPGKLTAAVRAGAREIAGVRVFQRASVSGG